MMVPVDPLRTSSHRNSRTVSAQPPLQPVASSGGLDRLRIAAMLVAIVLVVFSLEALFSSSGGV